MSVISGCAFRASAISSRIARESGEDGGGVVQEVDLSLQLHLFVRDLDVRLLRALVQSEAGFDVLARVDLEVGDRREVTGAASGDRGAPEGHVAELEGSRRRRR